MTTALEGVEWSAARPGRTLPPGKTRYPFYRRMCGPQGRFGRAKNLVPTGILSRTVQPLVSHYTDWATGPIFILCTYLFFFISWFVSWTVKYILKLTSFPPRTWPARSPDLTPCDYFLWGYVKDKVFVPPQPVSIPDLKNRITAAVETITSDLLSRVWQELDYRLYVCRVTKGAYFEHL